MPGPSTSFEQTMSSELKLSLSEVIAAKKAELAQRSNEIERAWAELAELERLAANLNMVESAAPSMPRPNEPKIPGPWEFPDSGIPEVPLLITPAVPNLPVAAPAGFDGTLGGLVSTYRTHPNSPYHGLKFRVRSSYDYMINRVLGELGDARLADLGADQIMGLYNRSCEGNRFSLGHAVVGKLRLLLNFGMITLKDDECTRLSVIMSKMRFKVPEARIERLTVDHVQAIRDAAHRHFNWHSIALAQVLQFELMLKQTDVLGEWVPASETGISDIFKGSEKWVRGLRWSNIDENLILRCAITSSRRMEPKEIEIDLNDAPMVRAELDFASKLARNPNPSGPLVVCEATGLPWSLAEFRRKWRMVANEAGIPMNVKNMDSGKADKPLDRTAPVGRIRIEGA